MKKSAIIIMSLLLVLTIGQSAFAKGNVELDLGYGRFQNKFTYPLNAETSVTTSAFNAGLSAEYYIINNLAIAGGVAVDIGTLQLATNVVGYTSYTTKFVDLDFELFGKYDVFNFGIGSMGLQVGIMDSMFKTDRQENFTNAFMIGLGVYGDVTVMPKLNISADAKFPLAFFLNSDSYSEKDGFFKLFLYDVDLKVTYDITPNIYAGLAFNVANADPNSIIAKINANNDSLLKSYSAFKFTIGANVGYRF